MYQIMTQAKASIHAPFFLAVDFVSAPFCVSKSHIYEGIENTDTFFRPALRSLLVSAIFCKNNYDKCSGLCVKPLKQS